MTTQFFQSSTAFARGLFRLHGMTPVDVTEKPTNRKKPVCYATRLADGIRQSCHEISQTGPMQRKRITIPTHTEDFYSREIFALRNQVFAERLKWQVVSLSGMEVDRYDLMNPWYVTIEDESRRVVGTWRALPTTGEYMLRDVFPELARGEDIPNDPRIWEISRLAIEEFAKHGGGLSEKKCVAALTLRLLNTIKDFAAENDVKAFVAVTSVAGERIMKKLGFKVRRMGDQKPMKIGKVLCTAIWIDADNLYSHRLRRLGL